jgi:uncharacterized protein
MEYALRSLSSLVARRRNAVSPAFWRMVRDILRFNAEAPRVASDPDMTIGQLLDTLGTGPWFRDYYILPFSGAIWSTPTRDILDFPAQALLRFFENHGLLDPKKNHQWYTVDGGSVQYVRALAPRLTAGAWMSACRPASRRSAVTAWASRCGPAAANGKASTRSSSPPTPTRRCRFCRMRTG